MRSSLVGEVLNDSVRLDAVLGGGAMGMVYRGEQLAFGRPCAVKVLRHELDDQHIVKRRFAREAKVTAKLDHPNIVNLYDFGITRDGKLYLVLELAQGHPLSAWRPYEPVDIWNVLTILEQVLSALARAHEQGIIHRDLKPDNIIVEPRASLCTVKVLDFGVAKMLEDEDHTVLTATGEVFGTPTYMSPEQATGSDPISPAVDLYAWGVIAYELLTGAPPFHAPTPLSLMMKHVSEPVPPLQPRPGLGITHLFAEIIGYCLAKRPAQRFVDAVAVMEAFTATEELKYLRQYRLSRDGAW